MNLCRNSGNVIGVTFATVVVTLTMAASGYPASLKAIGPTADPGVFAAFAEGFDRATTVLTGVAFVVLAIVVGWSWRAHVRTAAVTPP